MYLMREKKYKVRVPITMNLDNDTLQAFKELCRRDRLSLSERINSFMAEELKKEVGHATPIAITYNNNGSNYLDKRQTLISSFANYSTVKDSVHYIKDANLNHDDLLDIDRRYRNLGEGLRYIITNPHLYTTVTTRGPKP